jgi:hypothetical protein
VGRAQAPPRPRKPRLRDLMLGSAVDRAATVKRARAGYLANSYSREPPLRVSSAPASSNLRSGAWRCRSSRPGCRGSDRRYRDATADEIGCIRKSMRVDPRSQRLKRRHANGAAGPPAARAQAGGHPSAIMSTWANASLRMRQRVPTQACSSQTSGKARQALRSRVRMGFGTSGWRLLKASTSHLR